MAGEAIRQLAIDIPVMHQLTNCLIAFPGCLTGGSVEALQLFLQQFINGVQIGSVYALIAVGYTMVYGVLRFINFAHGDVYMLGAYFGFYAVTVALRAPEPVGRRRRWVADSDVRLRDHRRPDRAAGLSPGPQVRAAAALITAIGVSLLIENAWQAVVGSRPGGLPDRRHGRADPDPPGRDPLER